MTNRFFRLFLAIQLFFMIVPFYGHAATETSGNALPDNVSMEQLKVIFPDVYSVQERDTSEFLAFDSTRQLLGRVLLSSPFADKITGYIGPVPLLIGIDADEKITNILLLKNRETPEYVDKVTASGLLEQWTGLSKDEALKKKVDAVSGATFTSNAVIRSFQKRLQADVASGSETGISWFFSLICIAAVLVFAGIILYRFSVSKRKI